MAASKPKNGVEEQQRECEIHCQSENSKLFQPSMASIRYSLAVIQDEARQLVQQGAISRQQSIYTLCQYIPAREWTIVEHELEENDFLLRDCIGDLISCEDWSND